MGVVYGIGCKACKIWRDLDKLRSVRPIKTKDEALAMIAEMSDGGQFSVALLASFMLEHQDHECVLFDDVATIPEEDMGFNKEGIDLWNG